MKKMKKKWNVTVLVYEIRRTENHAFLETFGLDDLSQNYFAIKEGNSKLHLLKFRPSKRTQFNRTEPMK